MMYKLFLVFSFLFIGHSFAGIYIAGEAGSTRHIGSLFDLEVETGLTDNGPDISYKQDVGTTFTIGYRLNVIHFEANYINLGNTGFKYGDVLRLDRETKMIMGGIRFRWRWFSFRFGLGRAMVKSELEESVPSGDTLDHNIDSGDNSYTASHFSIGVNFPISESFNLFIESNGYSWTQDDGEISYQTSSGGNFSETLSGVQTMQAFNLGLRIYL